MVTHEPRPIAIVASQIDHLGYVRCGDDIDATRGGDLYERTQHDLLRLIAHDTPTLWVCDVCGRHARDWPAQLVELAVDIEHVSCKIY